MNDSCHAPRVELCPVLPDNDGQEAAILELQEDLRIVSTRAETSLSTRLNTIEKLRDLAENFDELHQTKHKVLTGGSVVGITGGLLTIGAGIATTVMTSGVALPAILSVAGTATGVGGAATNIFGEGNNAYKEGKLKAHLKEVIKDDLESLESLNAALQKLDILGNDLVPVKVNATMFLGATYLFQGIIYTVGSDQTFKLFAMVLPGLLALCSKHIENEEIKAGLALATGALPKLQNLMSSVAKEVAVDVTEEFGKRIVDTAVEKTSKNMADGFTKSYIRKAAKAATKDAIENLSKNGVESFAVTAGKELLEETAEQSVMSAAQKAANKTVMRVSEKVMKESMPEMSEEAAKRAAQKAAKKAAQKVAERAAQKASKKAVQDAAEQAAKEAAKKAARLTGGVTAGFGAIAAAWEGYNAYQSITKLNTKSEIGTELRILASRLENNLYSNSNNDMDFPE